MTPQSDPAPAKGKILAVALRAFTDTMEQLQEGSRMRRQLLALGIAASLAAALGFVASQPAKAQPNYCDSQVAIYYGNNHAWNNWGGNAMDGNPIDFYQSTTVNNSQWCVINKGNVSDGTAGVIWPFTDGSGLNTRYNGDPVYQFEWGPNTAFCADQANFQTVGTDDGETLLQKCTTNGYNDAGKFGTQYYVYSPSYYLANVFANNATWGCIQQGKCNSSDIPQLQGDGFYVPCSDNNGVPVFSDYNCQLQFTLEAT